MQYGVVQLRLINYSVIFNGVQSRCGADKESYFTLKQLTFLLSSASLDERSGLDINGGDCATAETRLTDDNADAADDLMCG